MDENQIWQLFHWIVFNPNKITQMVENTTINIVHVDVDIKFSLMSTKIDASLNKKIHIIRITQGKIVGTIVFQTQIYFINGDMTSNIEILDINVCEGIKRVKI